MRVNAVYLISLHDNTLAKLRIDRMSNASITFSYVTEAPAAEPTPTQAPTPAQQAPVTPVQSTPASPSSVQSKAKPVISLKLDSRDVNVDGKANQLEPSLEPRLVEGRTLVPLRFLAEALGSQVAWDAGEEKIMLTLDSTTVILWLDRMIANVNGEKMELDVPPRLLGDSTFVPLRFISEKLGQKVAFNSEDSTIMINGAEDEPSQEQQVVPISSSRFVGTYSLFIPGDSYTTDNHAAETRTNTTFLGSSDGTLSIYSDGTFEFSDSTNNWNGRASKYDAGIGTWRSTGKEDYPILLTDSRSGKEFKVGESTTKLGGDIVVWEVGGTWEVGTRH
jgi:hypothetical protein